MVADAEIGLAVVNCRIGSLENKENKDAPDVLVNCRIGSLEMSRPGSRL